MQGLRDFLELLGFLGLAILAVGGLISTALVAAYLVKGTYTALFGQSTRGRVSRSPNAPAPNGPPPQQDGRQADPEHADAPAQP